MKSALVACALGLLVLPALAKAAPPAEAILDRLSPMPPGDVMTYLDAKGLDVARRAELLVRVTRTFRGDYIVGLEKRAANAWLLIGQDNQGGPVMGPGMAPQSCTRPIDAALAVKAKALWAKILGEATRDNGWDGLDGDFYDFYMRGTPRAGNIWSPDEKLQPRMTRLARLADQMLAVCVHGSGVDALNGQINYLLR